MSNYVAITPLAGAQAITETRTAPAHPIGLEIDAFDRSQTWSLTTGSAGGGAYGRFVYARGSNMGSAGQFVSLVNGSAVLVASGNSASAEYPIGVGAGKLSATNVYGWVQVQGRCDYVSATTDTGLTAGVQLYLGGTAGMLQSNVVLGNRIHGVAVPFNQTLVSTAATRIVDLNRPYLQGLTASN
jgi:hypothetical protein